MEDESVLQWVSVIGRALAFQCLHQADLRDEKIAVQAAFLEGLGVPRRDAALMLGTSEASLRELLRIASQKKGVKRAAKKRKEK